MGATPDDLALVNDRNQPGPSFVSVSGTLGCSGIMERNILANII